MDLAWAQPVLEWLAEYPAWALLAVFAMAFSEGMAVVGTLLPGAVLLFVAGALVGTGHLPLWPTLAAAFLGALLGDSLGYWLGCRYGHRLRTYWPLSRYPDLLARGDALFAAHGGKGLVLSRFIGPIRGIVPIIAGTLRMPARSFLAVTFFAALAWAPAYLVPGLVFGASLAVAASVAMRLVALLLVAGAGAWAVWWFARYLLAPRLRRAAALIAWRGRAWERLHPAASRALSGPRHALRAFSHGTGWLWWGAVAVLVLLALRQWAWGGPTLLDEALLALLVAGLPDWGCSLLVVPALLLDPWVWVPAWLAAIGWILRRGRRRVALVLALIVPGAVALALLLGWPGGHGAEPAPLYRGAPPLAFPSAALAGLTALVLATGVLATVAYGRWRRPVRLLGVAVPLLVGASSVVAGQRWPTDALGGVLAGAVVAGLVVLARSASLWRPRERALPAVVAVVLLAAVAGRAVQAWPEAGERCVARAERPELSVSEWLQVGPAHPLSRDLRWLDGGRRPVAAQWLATPEALEARIDGPSGWHRPERGLYGALRWLQPEPDLARMAPLPRWHRGRLPALVGVRPIDRQRRLVLRLWPARVEMPGVPGAPWLVGLTVERVQPSWPVALVGSRVATPAERAQAVAELAGPADLRARMPAQPVRILPARWLRERGGA